MGLFRSNQAGWPFALCSIFFAQCGSVISKMLIPHIGPAGTAWMRILCGGIILLIFVRPSLSGLTRADAWALGKLATASAFMSLLFLFGIERLPLGMALSIEYLGPLTVAALASRNRLALAWPFIALTGVLLVTEPWHGTPDLLGIAFILGAGFFWALYIVFTQQAGDRMEGPRALALSVPVSALIAAFFGAPQAMPSMTPPVLLACIGLGFLHPGLTFLFEMRALHVMNRNAYGTLLAIAPAVGALLASFTLHESMKPTQWFGIVVVVAVGALSQRDGGRDDVAPEVTDALERERTGESALSESRETRSSPENLSDTAD